MCILYSKTCSLVRRSSVKVKYQGAFLFHKCILFHNDFNPFPNKPWFIHVCSTSLLKALREKEKFSFPPSVFYHLGELSAILIKFEIVVCKIFQFGRVKNFLFGKWLRITESLYRRMITNLEDLIEVYSPRGLLVQLTVQGN